MTRHRPSGGYSHRWRKLGPNHYRLYWTWDRYYEGSRLRHCKKWNLQPFDPEAKKGW